MVSALSRNFGLIGQTVLDIVRCSYFGIFAWNCLFTPTFRRFGAHFYQMSSFVVLYLLVRKHVVWAIKNENRYNGSTCARAREKGEDNQKSHKGAIFHLLGVLGRSPTKPICVEIWTVVAVPDVITCAKFWTEIFWGYGFTGGRISYWFMHGPYNSAALMRCLWKAAYLWSNKWFACIGLT